MSMNKRKFYRVITTQVVSANSKRDAVAKSQRKPHVDADILGTFVDGERLPAKEARSTVDELISV